MADAYVLLSHVLSNDPQGNELRRDFHVRRILYLPPDLQEIWSQLDVDVDYLKNMQRLLKHLSYETMPGDFLIASGEFGITYAVVSWAIQNGRIPLYASSERCVVDETDANGTVRKTTLFRHRRFARYERPWARESPNS